MTHLVGVKLNDCEGYNLLGRKAELEASDADNVSFVFDPNMPILDFQPVVLEGLKRDADLVIHKMSKKQIFPDKELFFNHMKIFYTFFVNSHPKDDLISGNGLDTGFATALHEHFKEYKLEVLRYISKRFIFKRQNHMNRIIQAENKARNERNAQKRAEKSLEKQVENAGKYGSY